MIIITTSDEAWTWEYATQQWVSNGPYPGGTSVEQESWGKVKERFRQ
jgi:hypothetical protein